MRRSRALKNPADAAVRAECTNDDELLSYEHHADEQCESFKDQIRHLYTEEQEPPFEIVGIMSQEKIHVTEEALDQKIKQRRLVSREHRRSAQPQRARNRRPLTRSATRNSQSSPHATTVERQRSSVATQRLAPTGAQHAASQIPTMLLLPDPLRFREGLIGGFEILLNRHYSLDPILHRGIVPFLGHIVSESRQSINDLVQSSWFFAGNQIEHGGRFASRAFERLFNLFRDQDFYSLLYLFINIPRMKDSGLLELFWKCLAGNASDPGVLGRSHPLSTLLRLMRDFCLSRGVVEFSFAVHDALKAIFRKIELMGNVDDFCMTWLRCDYAWSIGFDQGWVQMVHNEVGTLRNSLKGGLEHREVQSWSESMSSHLRAVQSIENTDAVSASVSPGAFEASLGSNDGRPFNEDTLQTMCFRTMSQYQRALQASYGLGSSVASESEGRTIEAGSIFNHLPLVTPIETEDLRHLEVRQRQASRWEEVEAAKVKWVIAMWMLP